jgi:hypothetical protein
LGRQDSALLELAGPKGLRETTSKPPSESRPTLQQLFADAAFFLSNTSLSKQAFLA